MISEQQWAKGYDGDFLSLEEKFDLMIFCLLLLDRPESTMGWVPCIAMATIRNRACCFAVWADPDNINKFGLVQINASNSGFVIDDLEEFDDAAKRSKHRVITCARELSEDEARKLGEPYLLPVEDREHFEQIQEFLNDVLDDVRAQIIARHIAEGKTYQSPVAG